MDVGTIVYTLLSVFINLIIVVLFSFQHLKHPLLRARNLQLFYAQTFSGVMWTLGSLLSFDHAESLQTLHSVSCGLSFYSMWVFGGNLFVTCTVIRLQSVYTIFFGTEEQLKAENRLAQRKRLVLLMMGPCCVLGFVLLGGECADALVQRTETGCIYSTPIKVCMMVCVWANVLILMLWLFWSRPRTFKRVPKAVNDYAPTLAAAALAGPVGIALSVLIMSNAWQTVAGRTVITVLTTTMVNVVLWSLGGRPLRDALTQNSVREKQTMQTLDVEIGAWDFDSIVTTPAMRTFMYDWIGIEGSSWLKSVVPLHTALVRWKQHPGTFTAADIIKRFVDAQSPHTVQGIPTHITQSIISVRLHHHDLPPCLFDDLIKWVEAEMENALTKTSFMNPSTAGKYYSTVKRHAQAVTVLEECGLLALPVEDEEETS